MKVLEEPRPGEVHGEEGVHVGGKDLVQELLALHLKREKNDSFTASSTYVYLRILDYIRLEQVLCTQRRAYVSIGYTW